MDREASRLGEITLGTFYIIFVIQKIQKAFERIDQSIGEIK